MAIRRNFMMGGVDYSGASNDLFKPSQLRQGPVDMFTGVEFIPELPAIPLMPPVPTMPQISLPRVPEIMNDLIPEAGLLSNVVGNNRMDGGQLMSVNPISNTSYSMASQPNINFSASPMQSSSSLSFDTVTPDTDYSSGTDYARMIAGGLPMDQIIAPGMSFSAAQPGGYTQADLNNIIDAPPPPPIIIDRPPPPPDEPPIDAPPIFPPPRVPPPGRNDIAVSMPFSLGGSGSPSMYRPFDISSIQNLLNTL